MTADLSPILTRKLCRLSDFCKLWNHRTCMRFCWEQFSILTSVTILTSDTRSGFSDHDRDEISYGSIPLLSTIFSHYRRFASGNILSTYLCPALDLNLYELSPCSRGFPLWRGITRTAFRSQRSPSSSTSGTKVACLRHPRKKSRKMRVAVRPAVTLDLPRDYVFYGPVQLIVIERQGGFSIRSMLHSMRTFKQNPRV